MRKKLVLFLLSGAFAMGSLSGCSKKTEAPVTPTQNPTKAVVESQDSSKEEAKVTYPIETKEPVKLTYWMPIAAQAAQYISGNNEHEVLKKINENTGIEVEYLTPTLGQEKEQMNLLMASGNLPDIIQIRGYYPGGSAAGVEDGVFMDLTDMIPTYAPDFLKRIKANDLTYRLATNNEGHITEFDQIKQSAPEFSRINMLDDIQEKYSPDGVPVTLADYEKVFEKMKADNLPGIEIAANGQVPQFMCVNFLKMLH